MTEIWTGKHCHHERTVIGTKSLSEFEGTTAGYCLWICPLPSLSWWKGQYAFVSKFGIPKSSASWVHHHFPCWNGLVLIPISDTYIYWEGMWITDEESSPSNQPWWPVQDVSLKVPGEPVQQGIRSKNCQLDSGCKHSSEMKGSTNRFARICENQYRIVQNIVSIVSIAACAFSQSVLATVGAKATSATATSHGRFESKCQNLGTGRPWQWKIHMAIDGYRWL